MINIKKLITCNIPYKIIIIYFFSLVIVFLLLFNSVHLINYLNLRISEQSGHYLYSALLQANAAILSIIGVFAVFKIQTIQSIIDTLKGSRLTDMGLSSTPTGIINFDNMSLKQKGEYISTANISPMIKGVYESWLEKEMEKNNIVNIVKKPIILLGISIFIYAILIILIDTIYTLGIANVLKTHILMLYLEFIILVELIRKILNIISVK